MSPVCVLIVFDSWEGHTAAIAKIVAEGAAAVPGSEAALCLVADATREHLQRADALVMGSPVHQRTMAWPVKRFVDLVCEPAWFYDDLVGRAGAVFATGGGHGDAGGNDWPPPAMRAQRMAMEARDPTLGRPQR